MNWVRAIGWATVGVVTLYLAAVPLWQVRPWGLIVGCVSVWSSRQGLKAVRTL